MKGALTPYWIALLAMWTFAFCTLSTSAEPQASNRIRVFKIQEPEQKTETGSKLFADREDEDKYWYSRRIEVTHTKPQLVVEIWEKVTGSIYSTEGPPWTPAAVVKLGEQKTSALRLDGVEFIIDLWAAYERGAFFLYIESRHRFGPAAVHIYQVPNGTGKITPAGLFYSRETLGSYYTPKILPFRLESK